MRKAILIALLSLSGCAQIAQQQRTASMERDSAEVDAACQAADSDPRLAAIAGKIPSGDPSLPQMTDPSKPTPDEKRALLAVDSVMALCLAKNGAYVAKYGVPGAYAAYAGATASVRAMRARLWAGEISYGQYNTYRDQRRQEFVQQNDRLERAEASAQEARDAQQRAAALQYLSTMPQYQYQRPTTTNCNRIGNSVNCTTY